MAQLQRRDFHAILEFLEGLYATRTLGEYVSVTTRGLLRLVPSDVCVYNEINPRKRRSKFVAEPAERQIPDAPKIWAVHMHDHPFLKYWHGGAKNKSINRAVTLSDFISTPEWHDRGLYTEFYRPNRMEHIFGVRLPAPGSIEIYLTVLRAQTRYTERDRLVLDTLREHLVAAHQNAEMLTERDRELQLMRESLEAVGQAIVVLDAGRRVRQIADRARDWLADYFGRWKDRHRLPPQLDDWIRMQELTSASTGDLPRPSLPLTIEGDGRRLSVRLLAEGQRRYLFLAEQSLQIEARDLQSLGLAPRETEVLAWVAMGKTNEAIADVLELSPATVKHCLERVYQKLGVNSRAAATSIAVRAAGRADLRKS
jgi:DNA-binding CsgD family transcriptional regulator